MDYSVAIDPGMYALYAVGAIAVYLYQALTLASIFRKAGLKTWPAWVPVFNVWRLLQLGGQKGWWALIGLVPVVGTILYLVFLIIAGVNIQTGFGKPGVFYLFAILLTPIWYGILAWDHSTWNPRHALAVPSGGYAGGAA